MDTKKFNRMIITDVQFLPIVKEYARRINLVDTINHMVPTQMDLKPGPVILGMILDILSGRSPLYRLKDYFEEKTQNCFLEKRFQQNVLPIIMLDEFLIKFLKLEHRRYFVS
jgi:hypothetical protein